MDRNSQYSGENVNEAVGQYDLDQMLQWHIDKASSFTEDPSRKRRNKERQSMTEVNTEKHCARLPGWFSPPLNFPQVRNTGREKAELPCRNTLGKYRDRSRQWEESGGYVFNQGMKISAAVGDGPVWMFVRSQAHEFLLCGEIRTMRRLPQAAPHGNI